MRNQFGYSYSLNYVLTIGMLFLQQLSLLGNHLFLDSLSFNDQYRDMRMDIDNMSYEVCSIFESCSVMKFVHGLFS